MKRSRIAGSVVLASLMLGSGFLLTGCATQGTKEVTLDPAVSSSALVTAGTLTVGVDSSNAPFGGLSNEGTSEETIIGLDVDVAAAIATELGLSLEVVDISGDNVIDVIEGGEVDIAMSTPVAQTQNTSVSTIGPYLENGSALFGQDVDSTVDLDSLGSAQIGAYTNSVASRAASEYCDSSNLVTYTSLSDAFAALEDGEVEYVASDIVAGGYLSMSYEGVAFAASLDDPSGVYIGVLQTNTALSEAVLEALQTIYGNGVLDTVVSKWTGVSCAEYVMPIEDIALNAPSVTVASDSGEEESESESE